MFEKIVSRYLSSLDTTLQQCVDDVSEHDAPELGLMLRYAMGWVDKSGMPYNKPTGKRLRPTLLLLCCEAAGGDWNTGLNAAAAVELLHNFSLIHDDIQDASELRHNRPTLWQIWGSAMAINAGDALFTTSYHALHRQSRVTSPEDMLVLWDIFNRTNMELTRGQHLDMRFENQNHVTTDEYISMIKGKSAALLASCAELGSFIATSDRGIADHFHEFGLALGVAFQIRDDILGIWGDPGITGKSAATDIISKKKSLPVLYGLTESPMLAELYQKDAFSDADVKAAVAELVQCGAQDYARSQERIYYERALQSLQDAGAKGDAAQLLHNFATSLFERTY